MLRITAYADRLARRSRARRLARGHAHRAAPTGSAVARAPRSTSLSTATRTRASPSSRRAPTRSWARPTSCSRPSTRWSRTLTTPARREAVDAYVEAAARKSDLRSHRARQDEDRRADGRLRHPPDHRRARSRSGSPTTSSAATAPAPSWPCPAHDERDFAFATALRSADRRGREPGRQAARRARGRVRRRRRRRPQRRVRRPGDARVPSARSSAELEALGRGRGKVTYQLRDWVFSRQRYWGEPIPIYFPVELADPTGDPRRGRRAHDSLRPAASRSTSPSCRCACPSSTTSSPGDDPAGPLARAVDWRFFQKDGRWFARETNTMPQWAGSCWYYLRFLDPRTTTRALVEGGLRRVDARRPLRRRRRARGAAPPLRALLAQGALRPRPREAPRAVHEARAPGDDPGRGQREDVEVARQRRQPRRHRAGARRRRAPALRDVHGPARGREAVADVADPGRACASATGSTRSVASPLVDAMDDATRRLLHKTIKKVTQDIDAMAFNTAISAMMVFVNHLAAPRRDAARGGAGAGPARLAVRAARRRGAVAASRPRGIARLRALAHVRRGALRSTT